MPTRRTMIASTARAFMAWPLRGFLQDSPVTEVTEEYKGDPDLPVETVTFNPAAISAISDPTTSGRAVFDRYEPMLPGGMLAAARLLVGSSRTTTPAVITEMLGLFGLPLKDRNDKFLAYCAAGISFCALTAYANAVKPGYDPAKKGDVLRSLAPEIDRYYFMPTVSCPDMWNIAKGRRRWQDKAQGVVPKPGWIVLFDWEKRGRPNHCGIVQNATANSVFTVEFNTSQQNTQGSQRDGGVVASRTRTYEFILGYIKTDLAPPNI